MSYLALARKWRPKTFSEVVGQSHVVQALSNALTSGRVHHAFLFTGTRGVGKTTLARIFAKSLNCEEGMSAEPCGTCGTCLSIDEGRFVDLIEVDAASRTKVEDTRELLENVHYAPTSGKYKVYLIDEVHMLSGHSFNALLKTLEEPPEHVKFLFATTDPQKVPVTVLSRCLQFNLRAMRPEQIENQFVKISQSEQIEYEQTALRALAKAAEGSMRDGLSLLDQAIAQGEGRVSSADVESMLGTIKAEHTQALLKAVANSDIDQVLDVVHDMDLQSVDFSRALDEILIVLHQVALAQMSPAAFSQCDADQEFIREIQSKVGEEQVQLYYQIGLLGKRDIELAPSLRTGFEMALMRMLAFEPVDGATQSDPETAVTPAPKKETRPESVSEAKTQAVTPNGGQQAAPAQRNGQAQVQEPRTPSNPQVVSETAPTSSNAGTESVVAPKPVQKESVDANVVPSTIAVTLAGNNEWGEMVEASNLIGLPKELAMNCACERVNEGHIQLSLAPQLKHLFKEDRLQKVEESMGTLLNGSVKIDLDFEASDKETPAECLARLGHEQFEQTKAHIHNDPGVKALMNEFNATINEDSIKPI